MTTDVFEELNLESIFEVISLTGRSRHLLACYGSLLARIFTPAPHCPVRSPGRPLWPVLCFPALLSGAIFERIQSGLQLRDERRVGIRVSILQLVGVSLKVVKFPLAVFVLDVSSVLRNYPGV